MSMLCRRLVRLCHQSTGVVTRTRHCSSVAESNFMPRRAMLYVPGNEEKKVRKIATLDVDCACLDCEDGVALNRKAEARQTILRLLDELDFGGAEPVVRINSVNSGFGAEDLRVVLKAEKLPSALLLPKVEASSDIEWFVENLSESLKNRMQEELQKGQVAKEQIGLLIYVESALGLLNLQKVCESAMDLANARNSQFHLDGVVFGSDDFCADIGATRTDNANELLYARQKIVTVAKAFRLQVIDMVQIAYQDTEALKLQSEDGARMGFTGKQCIHPIQVPIVQKAYSPSDERIKWARELIQAFVKHHESGKGAFTFKGSMIDMPSLLQAKNIVQMAQSVKSSKSNTQTSNKA